MPHHIGGRPREFGKRGFDLLTGLEDEAVIIALTQTDQTVPLILLKPQHCPVTDLSVFDGFGQNLLDAIPEEDRWTHYYAGERHKTQLDYIIASPALAAKLVGTPEIIRAGMPERVPNLDIKRYPRTGWDRPKASDHCPVVAEFNI